jgi:hypothetical protein
VIIPLYKKGDETQLENYRPISLLSIFSKILEKLFKRRLIKFLDKNQVLSPSQFGFRSGMGTEYALESHLSKIYRSVNASARNVGLYIDIKKAFDTIDHFILLRKIEQLGIRGIPLRWIKSYLTLRSQCVKVEKSFSEYKIIESGVPQGSVLGPILFLLYVNDLCNHPLNGHLTAFADDIALCYQGHKWKQIGETIQEDVDLLNKWFSYNGLKLSEKTKYICYNIGNSPSPDDIKLIFHDINCDKTTCSCAEIGRVDHLKYLGLILDQTLKWDHQISSVSSVVRNCLRKFYYIRNKCTLSFKKVIYHALVQSKLNYGLEFWGGAYTNKLKPALILQKKIIRIINQKNKMEHSYPLFVHLNILPLQHLYVYKVLRLFYIMSGNKPNLSGSFLRFNLRKGKVNLIKPNLTIFKRCFVYMGPKVYNMLPDCIKEEKGSKAFLHRTRKWLLAEKNIVRFF